MTPWPIADVVPHTGDMIVLDHIETVEAERIVCVRTVQAGDLFVDTDGHLPAWTGIELMAQAIAAWAGCRARAEQRPVRLGFLLGTRHYTCNVEAFPAGTRLHVEAERSFHDDQGMGAFSCRIEGPGIQATARLNVYSPLDADALLKQFDQGDVHA